jgi:hypothetical protein
MIRQVTRTWALLGLVAVMGAASAWTDKTAAQNEVNPDAALTQRFENRVADYVKLHKNVESNLPKLTKPTKSPATIRHHAHELRVAIVAQRPGAVEGNIFAPEIGAEFRRLIDIAYQADARIIRESLRSSEPGTENVRVRVNKEYPDDKPLQTMPATLLLNLPQLPPELEYRIIGRDLVLRDVGANLIVDIIPKVIPK